MGKSRLYAFLVGLHTGLLVSRTSPAGTAASGPSGSGPRASVRKRPGESPPCREGGELDDKRRSASAGDKGPDNKKGILALWLFQRGQCLCRDKGSAKRRRVHNRREQHGTRPCPPVFPKLAHLVERE